MLSMQNNIKSASIASSKIYAFSFCAISLWIFANRIHCRPSLRQDRLIWPTFGQRCGFIRPKRLTALSQWTRHRKKPRRTLDFRSRNTSLPLRGGELTSRAEIGDLDELGMLLEQIFRGNPGSGEGFLAILDRRPAHIALHISQPGATRA